MAASEEWLQVESSAIIFESCSDGISMVMTCQSAMVAAQTILILVR